MHSDSEFSGFLDVKQPSCIRGRKLKTWKRKWVAIHLMSNLSSGNYAAKVDIYPEEESARKNSKLKFTIVLDSVTAIKLARSKSHKHAFEIVETEPVIMCSGDSEADSQAWMYKLRQIFWPDSDGNTEETFEVFTVKAPAPHSYFPDGVYNMTVNQKEIKIVQKDDATSFYSWPLVCLKRFDVENKPFPVLIIESGAKARCGEYVFWFQTNFADDILKSIRTNIYTALARRRQEKLTLPLEAGMFRGRCHSDTQSMQGIKALLQNSGDSLSVCSSPDAEEKQSLTMDTGASKRDPEVQIDTIKRSNGVLKDSNLTENINTHIDADSHVFPIAEGRSIPGGTEYNRLDFSKVNYPRKSVDSFSVIQANVIGEGVVFDESGYTHIPVFSSSNETEKSNEKERTLSSASFGSSSSKDSGILTLNIDQKEIILDNNIPLARTQSKLGRVESNSFDSAISTSTTSSRANSLVKKEDEVSPYAVYTGDLSQKQITIQPFLSDSESTEDRSVPDGSSSSIHVYDDIEKFKSRNDSDGVQSIPKSHSFSNVHEICRENDYEELDKFRKDINQFLGISKNTNPKDVPPALPDRPTSSVIPRRAGNRNPLKTFLSFPRVHKNARRNSNITSSSFVVESSSDDDDSEVTRIESWPLSDSSVIDKNILYHGMEQDVMSNGTRQRRRAATALNTPSSPGNPGTQLVQSSFETAKTQPLIDLLTDDIPFTNGESSNSMLKPLVINYPFPSQPHVNLFDSPNTESKPSNLDSVGNTNGYSELDHEIETTGLFSQEPSLLVDLSDEKQTCKKCETPDPFGLISSNRNSPTNTQRPTVVSSVPGFTNNWADFSIFNTRHSLGQHFDTNTPNFCEAPLSAAESIKNESMYMPMNTNEEDCYIEVRGSGFT